ncbi:MAG: DUF4962 domain-containing protein [Clostridia bacterium]|nr:DUF4962 domain-containing protein [Clostridia bacterium]
MWSKITAVFSAIALFFSGVGIGDIIPWLDVIPDMVEMGIDYISLDRFSDAPEKDKILDALSKSETSHPFVLADKELFAAAVNEYLSGAYSDSYAGALYSYVLGNAEGLLDTSVYPPMEYVLDEEDSILPISREVINRIVILGFAYKVTGEEKYAERAEAELTKVCSYDDWCPSHFLAAAEMALAVSIGYDWLFDYLSDDMKSLLSEKTWEYAITPALSKNYLKNWFTWSKNNWNSICYSGIGIACMTFYEKNPEKAAEFLAMCYKNMPIAFSSFTPDGVYAEGPGYCQSGMNSIVYFIATSRNFFGTDFGMSEIDGFRQLGFFPVYITGSTAMFNFGDNKDRMCYSPVLHWYASEYEEPLLSVYQSGDFPGTFNPDRSENVERNGEGKENALSLLWYNRENSSDSADFSDVPLAVQLDSDMGQTLTVMRSAYQDKNATYAAIKGGYNYINHGDLDIGTFVFDALGERWAEELGPGNYDADGYFLGLPAGGRWKNYCKRAEGQNTLVINPDLALEDQYALARASFTSFEENENGGKCALDMTDAYAMNMAKSVTREFELFDNRSSLKITDNISCRIKSEIYWFMHTKAEIEISEDGKSAILTKNGKQLKATLSGDGEFSVMKAEKLGGKYEFDDNYDDIRKLTVHLEDVTDAVIEVTLTPVE